MIGTQIKNIQTRMCHYPILYVTRHADYAQGYYFFDEEFEEMGERRGEYGQGYFGPYPALDDVCKAQNRHYQAIESL